MTRAAFFLAFAALIVAAAASPSGQQRAQERVTRGSPGAGWIAGRLTAWGTGAPLRGAEVSAFLVDESGTLKTPAAHQTVVTGDDGRFEFRDLPLGAWRITASKTGYVTWQLGQQRPHEVPPLLVLAPGRARVTADFSLPSAGAIEGRVYDELGDPVSNARVTVYRARMARGRRHLQAVGRTDQTDDTGAFRVYGLAPGQYYVAASLRVAPAGSVMDTTYAPTYFPGTGSLSEAQRIALAPGADAIADFQLLPLRRLRVTGSVFTSTGAPASAFLSLVSEASEFGVPLGSGAATRSDGTFVLPDVTPGQYTLFASLRNSQPGESAEIPLTVGLGDVTGLTLVTSPPAIVRGTIVADPAATRPVPGDVGITSRSFRVGGPAAAATVSGDSFEIASPGGPFYLDVHGLPEGWAVKSIEIDGVDATDAPVDLQSQRSAEARIVLTNRVTEVTGTAAAGTHSVVVFPSDPARWSSPARYIRVARPDARGNFRIAGLPPGSGYLAVAVDYLEEGEGEDADFLSSVSPLAMPFSLEEGETRSIVPVAVQR